MLRGTGRDHGYAGVRRAPEHFTLPYLTPPPPAACGREGPALDSPFCILQGVCQGLWLALAALPMPSWLSPHPSPSSIASPPLSLVQLRRRKWPLSGAASASPLQTSNLRRTAAKVNALWTRAPAEVCVQPPATGRGCGCRGEQTWGASRCACGQGSRGCDPAEYYCTPLYVTGNRPPASGCGMYTKSSAVSSGGAVRTCGGDGDKCGQGPSDQRRTCRVRRCRAAKVAAGGAHFRRGAGVAIPPPPRAWQEDCARRRTPRAQAVCP